MFRTTVGVSTNGGDEGITTAEVSALDPLPPRRFALPLLDALAAVESAAAVAVVLAPLRLSSPRLGKSTPHTLTNMRGGGSGA
jgi:hypothetical protein